MKSKTVIAFAVASACAWPLVSTAYDSVSTPRSVNETSDAQVQHDRFTREDRALMDNGSWEVATPLSTSEVGPAESWTGFEAWAHPHAHDRYSRIESGRGEVMTAPADNETALNNQGSYNGYLVEVPAQTGYYIVEPQPSSAESTTYILEPSSSSYDVVLIPYDSID
ncbi:MAG TPA: hypothetical protein VLN59_02865 [Burkholderiales bacterium]|nr:hypothetical protein [Burkholderiales bacterium]